MKLKLYSSALAVFAGLLAVSSQFASADHGLHEELATAMGQEGVISFQPNATFDAVPPRALAALARKKAEFAKRGITLEYSYRVDRAETLVVATASWIAPEDRATGRRSLQTMDFHLPNPGAPTSKTIERLASNAGPELALAGLAGRLGAL